MEISDKYIKKLFILIVLMFCSVTTAFPDKLEDRLQDKKAFRDHELTEQEQQIFDHLNGIRLAKDIDVLKSDLNLSKALKARVYKIINDKNTPDTLSTTNRVLQFIFFLGGKTFLIKGRSMQETLDNITQNTDLCRELGLSDNIKISFCCVRDTLTDYSYSIIYLTKYYIEFFPHEAKSFPGPSRGSVTWVMNLHGKTNARYIKYILYQGDMLPFYYSGNNMITEEFQAEEDGYFSFNVTFHIRNFDIWRRAIFAKNDLEETFSLIHFGPM